MNFLYILLAIVVLITTLLLLNVRFTVKYGDKTYASVGALFFEYRLSSSRKKKKTNKKKKTSETNEKTQTSKKKSVWDELKDGLEISDFIELLKKLLIRMVETSQGHVKVKIKRLEIIVSDEYADAAALKFGAVNTAVALLLEYLENNTQLYPLEKCSVFVRCDFEKKQTKAEAEIVAKVRVAHILVFILKLFFDFMKLKESKNNTSLKGTK